MAFLTDQPIDLAALHAAIAAPDRGGVASFVGTVRNHHGGRAVLRLDYSAYGPMAEAECARIVSEAEARWPVAVALRHRTGPLAIGDAAVAIVVAAPHRDAAFAKTKGFPAPLSQAMMSTAYVYEPMTRFVGAIFVKGDRMAMTFIKPVLAGDTLTVHGVVKERQPEGGRTRVVVEVWCENQHGEKTAVGTASGLID